MSASSGQVEPLDHLPVIKQVSPFVCLRWLALGWADFKKAGRPSLLHGLIVTVASIVIVSVTFLYWPLLPGAVTGFVLVGPILATGLYALSRRLEHGETPTLRDSVATWRQGSRHLIGLSAMLVLSGTAWVLISMLLFRLFVDDEIDAPLDFLRYVVNQDDMLFLLWMVLGGLGVAVVFGFTVVSVPLLIDREIDLRSAMLVSLRAVGDNPIATAVWAILIAIMTGLSVATLMLGFLILYPVLGHASWHAYRDLVDASRLTPRDIQD